MAAQVPAELRSWAGRIVVGHNRVSRLMRTAGPVGLPLKRRFKNRAQVVTALDLVNRQFAMPEPK